jgi:hypothetical protein
LPTGRGAAAAEQKKNPAPAKLAGEALNLFINYLGRRYVRVASPLLATTHLLPLSTRALVEKIFNFSQINYARRGKLHFSLLTNTRSLNFHKLLGNVINFLLRLINAN